MRASARLHGGRILVLAALLALLPFGTPDARRAPERLPDVAVEALPPQALEVLASIRRGGPFRYERDGVVFGNRERLLPPRAHGYYHEYTVPTPGLRTRGARRIICGGPRTHPDACFYTEDHYRSFRRIRR